MVVNEPWIVKEVQVSGKYYFFNTKRENGMEDAL